MILVIVKVNLKTILCFQPYRCFFVVVMFVLSCNSLHQNTRPIKFGTGSVDGLSVLMEGGRGQHEHHNRQNSYKIENKGWFAILLYYKHSLLPVVVFYTLIHLVLQALHFKNLTYFVSMHANKQFNWI